MPESRATLATAAARRERISAARLDKKTRLRIAVEARNSPSVLIDVKKATNTPGIFCSWMPTSATVDCARSIRATYGVSQIASGLLAWIERALERPLQSADLDRPKLAGQRPSRLNASGLIVDGRRTTLTSHTRIREAAVQEIRMKGRPGSANGGHHNCNGACVDFTDPHD